MTDDWASAVASYAELRLVGPADRKDKQSRVVEDRRRLFEFDAGDGADVADDDTDIIRPTDIPVESPGRWYGIPRHATTSIPGLQSPADKTYLDRTSAAFATSVEIKDESQIISLASGRQRHVAPNVLSANRRITISNTGAVQGDVIVIDRQDLSHYGLQIANAAGTVIGEQRRPGRFVARYEAGAWKAHAATRRAQDSFFNVRDFGADGLDGQGNDVIAETASIQAAIDAAAAAAADSVGQSSGGATIFFPAGKYSTTTLIWRRTTQAYPLDFVGEGWNQTFILCQSGIAFQAENICDDPSNNGAYQHTFRHMSIATGNYACVEYNVMDVVQDSRRPQVHFDHVHFYRLGTVTGEQGPAGAVEIRFGFRCRFSECVFTGSNSIGRYGVVLRDTVVVRFTPATLFSLDVH